MEGWLSSCRTAPHLIPQPKMAAPHIASLERACSERSRRVDSTETRPSNPLLTSLVRIEVSAQCSAHRSRLVFDNLLRGDKLGLAGWLSGKVNLNSCVVKTLPLTPLRSRLWQELLPKVLILIYREGRV